MRYQAWLLLALVTAAATGTTAAVIGCSSDSSSSSSSGGSTAKATLTAVESSGVSGTATFTESGGKITLDVSISGAEPGNHGIHVHNGTDCANPGPHYGPDGGPYVGEYKMDIGADGTGKLSTAATDVTITGGDHPVKGHAMVFHKLLPDGGTPPAPRAACGVLE